ncbi:MAG: hypothetical protein U1E91_00495 [Moraxella sp.]
MDARKINMWASISPVVTAGVAGLLIGGLLGFWGWGLVIGLCLYQLYFLWSIQRFKAWYNKNPMSRRLRLSPTLMSSPVISTKSIAKRNWRTSKPFRWCKKCVTH